MIRITDRTLSCIDGFCPDKNQVERFVAYLFDTGFDYLELSEKAYALLASHENTERFVLRLEDSTKASLYPEIRRFVCRKNMSDDRRILTEIQANDIREINLLTQYRNIENVRICGLDDIMLNSSGNIFGQLKSRVQGKIELCPENSYGLAAAHAVEWLLQGNSDVVTAFSGIGNHAASEEVALALLVEKRYKPNQSYAAFQKLKELIEEITGEIIPGKKAVIGNDIFCVEAGIHIDGITKSPKNYEPFPPELVGKTRHFVTGKHSGRKAVLLKLAELGIDCSDIDLTILLEKIREKSMEINNSLSDEELPYLVGK
jgi:homocitrate synthase NifV